MNMPMDCGMSKRTGIRHNFAMTRFYQQEAAVDLLLKDQPMPDAWWAELERVESLYTG